MAAGLPDTEEPQTEHRYPSQSTCWLCGREVAGDTSMPMRRCSDGHDEVTWSDPLLPGAALTEHEESVKRADEGRLGRIRKRFGVPDGETPPEWL